MCGSRLPSMFRLGPFSTKTMPPCYSFGVKYVLWLLLCGFAFAQTHTVQPGETLYRIAVNYGTSVEALQVINNIADPSKIRVGQVLKVRGAPNPGPKANRIGNLPSPLDWIEAPRQVQQGQTFRLRIGLQASSPLEVRFLNQRYALVAPEALLAIPRLQEPGVYPLVVRAGSQSAQLSLEVVGVELGRQALTLPPDRADLLQQDRVTAERERLLAVCQKGPNQAQWTKTWQKPIDSNRITTVFGIRRSYNGGPFRSYHEGLDYGAPTGTPVYAPAPGVVGLAEPLFVRGNSVVVNHGLGVCSGYWHLSRISVKPGQRVNTGDLLGYVGSTGLSTGPHLHFEIRVNGVPTNPAPWYFAVP